MEEPHAPVHEGEEQNEDGKQHGKIAVADLLPSPVTIPAKRGVFRAGMPALIYFFADVIRIKRLTSRPIIGRPKAKRVMLLTVTRLYLCHPKTAEVSVDYLIEDIKGVVLIGDSDIGLLFEEEPDVLIHTQHELIRSKFVDVLKQLWCAMQGNQYPLVRYRLKYDVDMKDVLNLDGPDPMRYHPFVDVIHDTPPARPCVRSPSSSSSSSIPPPSASPSCSPTSPRSGRSFNSRVFDGYTEADHDYDELAERCHELEDVISELRGEALGLRSALDHFQQIREDGAYNTELLRQHFESEKTLALEEQVKYLSARVAFLQSENSSLKLEREDRSMSPSSALLSRQATQLRSQASYPTPVRDWRPDIHVRTELEAQFDSEIRHERSRLHT
eukprot:TRINITY_DN26879_c0_g1_i1.p1 TRINITY_DN26879_c0_g1~~TRINITY_DN26879_c0_g1_i1.p1  ORF type:complete len:386 (+),score=80.35 TRINITY_DN26879_c0_g1_i1:47-1204(+)